MEFHINSSYAVDIFFVTEYNILVNILLLSTLLMAFISQYILSHGPMEILGLTDSQATMPRAHLRDMVNLVSIEMSAKSLQTHDGLI